MKTKALLLAGLIVGTIPGGAMAEYHQIGRSDRDALSVDPATIKKLSDNIRSAWFKFDHSDIATSGTNSSAQLARVDCGNESTAIVSVVQYGAADKVISSYTNPTFGLRYEPAPPGTLAATMVRSVCSVALP